MLREAEAEGNQQILRILGTIGYTSLETLCIQASTQLDSLALCLIVHSVVLPVWCLTVPAMWEKFLSRNDLDFCCKAIKQRFETNL